MTEHDAGISLTTGDLTAIRAAWVPNLWLAAQAAGLVLATLTVLPFAEPRFAAAVTIFLAAVVHPFPPLLFWTALTIWPFLFAAETARSAARQSIVRADLIAAHKLLGADEYLHRLRSLRPPSRAHRALGAPTPSERITLVTLNLRRTDS